MIKIYNKNGVILNTQEKYCNENIEVAIDTTDLTPENIVKGKRILGVDGTAEAGSGGGIFPDGTINITENGIHDVTYYASANVKVSPKLQFKSGRASISDDPNFYEIVLPDEGYDGLSEIHVYAAQIPSEYIIPSGNFEITTNGDYDITDKKTVSVNVPTGGGGTGPSFDDYLDGNVASYSSTTRTSVGDRAFAYSTIWPIDIPNLQVAGSSSFAGVPFTELNFPYLTSAGDNCFEYNDSLVSIDLPALRVVGNSCFSTCRYVEFINLPMLETISYTLFIDWHRIDRMYLPSATSFDGQSFAYNEKLKTVIGGNLQQIIGWGTFDGCFDLKRLVLGCTSGVNICYLEDTSLFERCAHFLGESIWGWHDELQCEIEFNPQGLKDGIIYVHPNYIEEYKADTNWSQFAECFKGLVFDSYNEMANIDHDVASTYPNAYVKDEDKFYYYDSETYSWIEEEEE